jgi:hypothetical protein
MDLIVEIRHDTDVIWNDPNLFADLRALCAFCQIHDSMFFFQAGYDRLGIVRQKSVSFAFIGRHQIAGKRFTA